MIIDVGATKIKAYDNNLTAEVKTPHEKEDFILVLNHIIKTFNPKTIDLGYPGIIEKGIITKSHNLPDLLNFNLKKYLQTKAKLNFYNDAELFLKLANIGYNKFDAAITLGSGVGVAVKIKNKFQNIEYGHKLVTINGKKKEFEYFLGGFNIKERYNKTPREAWKSPKLKKEFFKALEKLINRLEKEFKIKSLVLGGSLSKLPLMSIKKKTKVKITRLF